MIIDALRARLNDGTMVMIRPLRHSDRAAVEEMHGRCSLQTRFTRYFNALTSLPQRVIDLLTALGTKVTASGHPFVAEVSISIRQPYGHPTSPRGVAESVKGLLCNLDCRIERGAEAGAKG
jgi:hypothetical protein